MVKNTILFCCALLNNDDFENALSEAKKYCHENKLSSCEASILKIYKENSENIDLVVVKKK